MDEEGERAQLRKRKYLPRPSYLPVRLDHSPRSRENRQYSLVLVVVVGSTVLITVLLLVWQGRSSRGAAALVPPDPDRPQPPTPSKLHEFESAAVCSDGPPCSKIGRDMLKRGGNAVDAAVAGLLCNGIVNSQSMGLGGGFLMTLFVKGKPYTLIARERAPLAAHKDMFKDNATLSRTGGLAVGVPGELIGYWEVWKRFGSLSWEQVVQPTLELCRDGYYMSQAQYDSLHFRPMLVKEDFILSATFVDPNTGSYSRPGTFIKPVQICNSLEIIAKEGGYALNNGSLTAAFVKDIQEKGGIVTEEDMSSYKVEWREPVSKTLHGGHTLYTVGPPGSGALLSYILSILDGFNLTRPYEDRKDAVTPQALNATFTIYQRIIEAFKFAFAKRPALGDPDFINVTQVMQDLTSTKSAETARQKMHDDKTFSDGEYYGTVEYSQEDHGTAHLSVLSKDGDAVSVTSTVNLYFGAGFASKSSGIIPNSVMDDFSVPGRLNYFDLKPSPNHFIAPGKRPLSSACPSIITDANGDVILVIGASGGTKIPTAISWVIIRHLWFGENIKDAIDASRFHHQLFPMRVEYEYGTLEQVVKHLNELGHKTVRYRERGSIVCAVSKQNGKVFANSDYRKGGEVYGI